MTNEEFFNAHMGERVLYKGKDIGAYVAGYVEEKYIILGFDDYTGCILCFTSKSEKSLWHISLIPIRKVEVFGSDKTSVIWKKKKKCCGNCLWMGCEDILGNGWCYKKDCRNIL